MYVLPSHRISLVQDGKRGRRLAAGQWYHIRADANPILPGVPFPVAAYVQVGIRQLGLGRTASHSRTGHRSGCTGFLQCVAIPVDVSRIALPINQAEPFSWMDSAASGCLDIHFCGAMGGDAGQFDESNSSCTSITLRRASSSVLAKTTVPVCSRSHSGQWSLRMTY